jgi:hypothetical protein
MGQYRYWEARQICRDGLVAALLPWLFVGCHKMRRCSLAKQQPNQVENASESMATMKRVLK